MESNIIAILFVTYFVQVTLHFLLLYLIMKQNKIISSIPDFIFNNKKIYMFMYDVFLKNKAYKTKQKMLILKTNAALAILILILIFLIILSQK